MTERCGGTGRIRGRDPLGHLTLAKEYSTPCPGCEDCEVLVRQCKPKCKTCGDTGELVIPKTKKPCPDCKGPARQCKPTELSEYLAEGSPEIKDLLFDIRWMASHAGQIKERGMRCVKAVRKLFTAKDQAKRQEWYIRPPEGPNGKGMTWIKYAQIEFKRAEDAEADLNDLNRMVADLQRELNDRDAKEDYDE